jgi:kinesin family protein 3/17
MDSYNTLDFPLKDGFPTPELQGLIPNSFEHIFAEVEASADKQWMVRASYLEIYNEEASDAPIRCF